MLATAMPIQLVSIKKSLIAVLTSRMAFKRKIVFVPVAFMKRQLFSIVMFALVGEQFEMFQAEFAVKTPMRFPHVRVELGEGVKRRAVCANVAFVRQNIS